MPAACGCGHMCQLHVIVDTCPLHVVVGTCASCMWLWAHVPAACGCGNMYQLHVVVDTQFAMEEEDLMMLSDQNMQHKYLTLSYISKPPAGLL